MIGGVEVKVYRIPEPKTWSQLVLAGNTYHHHLVVSYWSSAMLGELTPLWANRMSTTCYQLMRLK
jgi:catechol-2,3-dioxygenase